MNRVVPPAFLWPVRVYWEDTDAGGVVYYANYLKFCERARSEWLRQLGIAQQRLADEQSLLFVVSSASIQYHASARLDDALQISVSIASRGAASLELLQQVRRAHPADDFQQQPLLASVAVRIACVRAGDMRPQRLPAALLQALD